MLTGGSKRRGHSELTRVAGHTGAPVGGYQESPGCPFGGEQSLESGGWQRLATGSRGTNRGVWP